MATAVQDAPETILKSPFDAQEVQHLHDEDLHAARLVVGLITGVFVLGLFLYAFICWIAMS